MYNNMSGVAYVCLSCIFQEKERLRLHELLETETIRGSIIRHRLLFYPAEIQKEIDGRLFLLFSITS